ncbi:calcium-binding protein P-like [Dysidea avara]|uniref:calcium-binding protein P-like n=1 Tax=Dysidea avara TaxID=196820 RepID=UPI00332D1760
MMTGTGLDYKPPIDEAYPTAQGGEYPPPQVGYPPPQTGYPPPQAGYPPPQAGYPPGYTPNQQATYPPTEPVPPPYPGQSGDYQPPPPAPPPEQQPQSNIIVVTQPTQPTIVHQRSTIPDYTVLSIVMTVVCIFCNLCALACTIPAIFLSVQAKEEEAKGDHVSALQHARTALYLNIAAVIFAVVVWIVWIAAVAASA